MHLIRIDPANRIAERQGVLSDRGTRVAERYGVDSHREMVYGEVRCGSLC